MVRRVMGAVLVAAGVVLPALPAVAQGRGDWGSWGYGPWGMGYLWAPMGIGMMLMMFLFWGAIIFAIVMFVRWIVSPGAHAPGHAAGGEGAEEILRKRYARGEIDKEEYEAKMADLRR